MAFPANLFRPSMQSRIEISRLHGQLGEIPVHSVALKTYLETL
jgi:hypothetical protein